ncbi:MAG: hypothetical protein ACI307_10425 [Sodaliphilus sp.]
MTAKDNGGACFPLDFGITPTKGRQPSHPHRSGFFCSFHATYVPGYRNLEFVDFGAGEDFFCGIAKFYLFLEIEVGNGFIHIGVLPLVGTAAVWLSAHYQRLSLKTSNRNQ